MRNPYPRPYLHRLDVCIRMDDFLFRPTNSPYESSITLYKVSLSAPTFDLRSRAIADRLLVRKQYSTQISGQAKPSRRRSNCEDPQTNPKIQTNMRSVSNSTSGPLFFTCIVTLILLQTCQAYRMCPKGSIAHCCKPVSVRVRDVDGTIKRIWTTCTSVCL